MSFFHRLSNNPVRLFILSQTLLLLAFVLRDFPILIFVAIAPLFAFIDHPSALKESGLPFIVAIGTAFVFYYAMRQSMQQSSVLSWIIYFSLLAVVFAAYFLMQQWTHRLNKFALIIFILGVEYLFLKLSNELNPVFLADLLRHKTEWTRWNTYTGYAGATLWILVVNLLLYEALFAHNKINWMLGTIALLIIFLPIVYSLTLTNDGITKLDVIGLYSGMGSNNARYSERGELICRTGAWVSALIIIFTLVKGKTKKVLR